MTLIMIITLADLEATARDLERAQQLAPYNKEVQEFRAMMKESDSDSGNHTHPSDSTAGATGNTNGSGGLGADQHSTSTTFDLQH